jgi:predicted DNA-binding protein (MmcQ/YjbR family)
MKPPRKSPIDAATLLTQLSAICLALPETSREDSHGHASFRVRKKVFAYFLNNHHGDGIVSVCVKCVPGEQQELIELDPKRYYSPAYIGPRGWTGLRLDQGKVSWPQVERHITASYQLCAPKTLIARLRNNSVARNSETE